MLVEWSLDIDHKIEDGATEVAASPILQRMAQRMGHGSYFWTLETNWTSHPSVDAMAVSKSGHSTWLPWDLKTMGLESHSAQCTRPTFPTIRMWVWLEENCCLVLLTSIHAYSTEHLSSVVKSAQKQSLSFKKLQDYPSHHFLLCKDHIVLSNRTVRAQQFKWSYGFIKRVYRAFHL